MGAGGGEAEDVEATTKSEELVLLPTVMVLLLLSGFALEAVVLVSLEDIELRPVLVL